MPRTTVTIAALASTAVIASATYAAVNQVSIEDKADERCIISNGIPDHAIGGGNSSRSPNRAAEQDIEFCVTRNPEKGTRATTRVNVVGIMKNGVMIRPGTAEWYDASSSRKHSRDRSSGWNYDGMGSDLLGMDAQNAHSDHTGTYHYHGMPDALKGSGSDTFVGYAADGFEIHYAVNVTSSWQLKSGTRPSAPGGAYDGTFNQDFEYVAGSGTLDECNGATIGGKYMYFATDSYPFFPRCLYGTDITAVEREGGGQSGARADRGTRGPRNGGGQGQRNR